MRSVIRSSWIAALTALSGLCVARAAQEQASPRRAGRVEIETVTLLLLDVEAIDRQGRPLRGLTSKDFTVHLDGHAWSIYSVDDLCACDFNAGNEKAAPVPASDAPSTGVGTKTDPISSTGAPQDRSTFSAGISTGSPALVPAAPDVESVPPGTVVEARRFVIFLDFSQLTFGGRIRALDHASQWVHETMAVGDETMIAAFASGTGLEELHPFTSDKVRLLSTLERTKTDRAFIDPFPELIEARVRECEGTPPLCDPLATEEYFHGRRSLRAMKRLMSRLEEIPGRKSLLLFHENGFMDPGSVYHADSALHLQSAEEVAAAATLARTTIHAVYEGTMPADIGLDPFGMDREREALTLSSNLADFTGGTYARGSMDAPAFLREAGRGCRCLYRIGLVPPPVPSRRVYTVRVTAGGVPLRSALRVQFLSEADRWMRKAQVVLEDPSRARDIPVAVSIVPAAVSGSRWDVKVQVALHTDSLALLPEETGRGGEWETGALLHRLDAEKSWEMLGVYRVRRGIEGESAVPVVHEKLITDLKPGPYRLAAFVRDRTANVFGAAETTIDLPDPGDGGAAGPVLMLASRPRLDVPLPLYTERLADKVTSASRGSSSIPARADPIPRGTAIEALTWICPGKKAPPAVKAVTFLSRLGRRAFSTGSHVLEDGETCRRFTDRFETEPLEDGGYVYFVEWSRPAGGPGTVEAPLEIGPVQVVSK